MKKILLLNIMNSVLLIQYAQIILALYLFIMLFMKSPIKTTCDPFIICLILLVISLMIVPPMGRNFLSALNIRRMGM
jgi:hypothetical protein